METNIISKNFKLLWRLRCTVLYIIAITAFIMLIGLSSFIAVLAFVLISLIYLAAILWLIPSYYKRLNVSIIDNKLIIKRGIFFYKQTCISCDEIQCIKQLITPLGKLTGSCDHIFYFTTTSVYISGINDNIIQKFIK